MYRYEENQIKKILIALHIQTDKDGLLEPGEVAKVLTWRATNEYGIDHRYTIASVRSIVSRGDLEVAKGEHTKKRRYTVVAAFQTPLTPRRGHRVV